ncbi:MAG TPA: hypothetical protein VK929_14225 [Longimicrobiales bacterium]|nr:hypothetical protein [Longimicrobiales bacterium]
MTEHATAVVSALLLATTASLPAQQAPALTGPMGAGWDTGPALELVERSVARRALPLADTLLQQYTAEAEGTVQFLLESEAAGGVVPLRLDQVAVDLYWQAPGRSRQAIRALRKQDLLPIRQFHYYADRLTLVQEGFGDRIAIGDEQDVRGVPHPLSPDGPLHYHYRLADTLTLHVPGLGAPIRVVRVEVQPRDASLPGFVGDVFVDAEAATLVRMQFTFTPAAYVDPRTERIHVNVEHGLWEGRYWLPYRQELEVRRQAPEVDFGVSTLIRAQMTVRDYDFDTPVSIPDGMPRITFPAGEGDVSRFSETLDEVAVRQGLTVLSADDLAAGFTGPHAMLRLLNRQPDGLPTLRFHLPSFSSVLRANRAEGAVVGGGLSLRPGAGTLVTLHGGYASGPAHASVRVAAARALGGATLHLAARLNDVQEIEPAPEAGLFLNTVSTLLAGRDWTDPYYVDGVGAHLRAGNARLWWSSGVDVERHASADAAWTDSPWADGALRPVLPVDAGSRLRAVASLGWRSDDVAPRLTVNATTSAGAFEGDAFATLLGHAAARVPTPGVPVNLMVQVRAGASIGALPPQHLYLPAGTRTLPGVPPTTLAGSRFAAAGTELSAPLGRVGPVPLAAYAALNGAAVAGRTHVPEQWEVNRGAIARAAATVGLSAYGGIVRVDYSHGLPGIAEWRVRVGPAIAPLL